MEKTKESSTSPTPRNSLPPTFTENLTQQLTNILPDWLLAPFSNPQRRLIAMERKLQRKFLNEYRSQVKIYEPVLRDRGEVIGRAIIDTFTSPSHETTKINYANAEKQSQLNDVNMTMRNIKEVMVALDPLISPVLTPFVEGIRKPLNKTIGEVQNDVTKAFIISMAASLVGGVVIGRWTANRGRQR